MNISKVSLFLKGRGSCIKLAPNHDTRSWQCRYFFMKMQILHNCISNYETKRSSELLNDTGPNLPKIPNRIREYIYTAFYVVMKRT